MINVKKTKLQGSACQMLDVFIGSSQEKVTDCSMTDRHTH
jgi:hypothetical protein